MRRVYLDTCCVIYLLEEVAGLSDAMRAFLARHDDVLLCVSPLVRLEALIKPLQEGAHDLVLDYEGHFYKSAEAASAAPKSSSKCSHTACMLRFFAAFWLASIALIEFIEVP